MSTIHTYYGMSPSFFLKADKRTATIHDKYTYTVKLYNYLKGVTQFHYLIGIHSSTDIFSKCEQEVRSFLSYEEFMLALVLFEDTYREKIMFSALNYYPTYKWLLRMMKEGHKKQLLSYSNDRSFCNLLKYIDSHNMHSENSGLF